VLCQLSTQAPFGDEMRRWLPGFAADGSGPPPRQVSPDARIPTPDDVPVSRPPTVRPKARGTTGRRTTTQGTTASRTPSRRTTTRRTATKHEPD
jgi:hypothetical protein